MLKIDIRKASHSDLPTLIQNNLGLAKETENLNLDASILSEGIKQALERKECHYFVAVVNEKVVGQLMITYEWSDWRNGIIWWIQSVFVIPDYRKQGVFRALFKHIKNFASDHPQVKVLRLYVMNDNIDGQKTYERLGMNDSGYIVFEKKS
jgi:ribosomal protein S18 acetylase RimI-like enzyme